MDNKHHFSIWYFVFAFLFIAYLQSFFNPPRVENLPYSEFKILLKANKLEKIQLTESDISGIIILRDIDDYLPYERTEALNINGDIERAFYTVRLDDTKLIDDLEASGVSFAGKKENRWLGNVVSWVIPVLLFFALWSYLFRRMGSLGGGMMEIGKSKVKVYVEKDTKVTFADVAGVDEAKEELQEIVNFLNDPQGYSKLGARIPKGILLVGPPGTGKTLLARAVAGEAGVPFFSINGSEFVEMFVGVGAARVRDLFDQARQKAPAIIFIDELDALGRARGINPAGGGHDEKEQTLNQLLSEMDGFDPSKGLVLLSATNRPEILDPALLRAGRFDRQVLVDRPDKVGRVQILKLNITKVHLAKEINLGSIAALTPGFTGADLANLVNEAALLATRRKGEEVTLEDFTQAIERIVAGLEKKNRLLNPKEREVVAHHEMGHALVAMSLPGVDPVHKISIIPRGIGALGYTIQRPTEDRYLMTREELENKMAVLLGGRASERLIFNHLSTGAADDLAKATDIARSIVTRYGMDEKLGQVVYQEDAPLFLEGIPKFNKRDYSEETAREIDCAVRELINTAFENATDILIRSRDVLERGAKMLLEQETLVETELKILQHEIPLAAVTTIEST